MATGALSRRALNRALLARQLLLERSKLPVAAAIEQVAGLQAQVAYPPYLGLRARLDGFRHEDLASALESGDVVRATMMRSTIHLVTMRDYVSWRKPLEPAMLRALQAFNSQHLEGVEQEPIAEHARSFFATEARTFKELRDHLSELHPGVRPETMAYLARARLPLVQLPGRGPKYRLVDVDPSPDPREVIRRYLAAFGPATIQDVRTFTGLSGLVGDVKALRPELRMLRDEDGRELLDVEGGLLPGEGVDAPARLLPEYDNAILAHADRTRVIADEHRKAVFPGAGLVRATVLVDGFVTGIWRVKKGKVAVEWFGRSRARAIQDEVELVEELIARRR